MAKNQPQEKTSEQQVIVWLAKLIFETYLLNKSSK
jgi:hypothetical protein